MTDGTYLVVGLGNPGDQYQKTRHNVGFSVVNTLGEAWQIEGKGNVKFSAVVGKGMVRIAGQAFSVVLAQPTTYMNLSGTAVSALARFYHIEPARILVVFDDVALPLGKVRFRGKGSAGGHNGIKSLIASLGTDAFCRLRIGIGAPTHAGAMKHHVLSHFQPEELAMLDRLWPETVSMVETWMSSGVDEAMNRFNHFSVDAVKNP